MILHLEKIKNGKSQTTKMTQNYSIININSLKFNILNATLNKISLCSI